MSGAPAPLGVALTAHWLPIDAALRLTRRAARNSAAIVFPSQISPLSIIVSARASGTISLCSTSCASGRGGPGVRS